MRGVGAIGGRADRREHAQADAADRGIVENFQPWLRRGVEMARPKSDAVGATWAAAIDKPWRTF